MASRSSSSEHRRAQQCVQAVLGSITLRHQLDSNEHPQQSLVTGRCETSHELNIGIGFRNRKFTNWHQNVDRNCSESVQKCGVEGEGMHVLQKQPCFGAVQINELMDRLADMLGLSSISLGKPNLQDIHICTQKGQRSDGC